jgi:hypothetical protein
MIPSFLVAISVSLPPTDLRYMRDLARSCSLKLRSQDQAHWLICFDWSNQMLLLRPVAAHVHSVPCQWNASHAGRLDPEHHVVVVEDPTVGDERGSATPFTLHIHLYGH